MKPPLESAARSFQWGLPDNHHHSFHWHHFDELCPTTGTIEEIISEWKCEWKININNHRNHPAAAGSGWELSPYCLSIQDTIVATSSSLDFGDLRKSLNFNFDPFWILHHFEMLMESSGALDTMAMVRLYIYCSYDLKNDRYLNILISIVFYHLDKSFIYYNSITIQKSMTKTSFCMNL